MKKLDKEVRAMYFPGPDEKERTMKGLFRCVGAVALSVGLVSLVGDGLEAAERKVSPAHFKNREQRSPELLTARAGELVCKVKIGDEGIRVFLFDRRGRPLKAKGIRGVVKLRFPPDPKTYRFDLYPEGTHSSKPNALYASLGSRKNPGQHPREARFVLFGLPSSDFRRIAFHQMIPRPETSERFAAARQTICPVSGEKLGSMGPPVELTVAGREVSVCCSGCVNRLKTSPEKYLKKLPVRDPVRATKEDRAAAARQGICPVMQQPLDSMGGPWKVPVRGETVFVCCPGCVKRLHQEPERYLKRIAVSSAGGESAKR